MEENDEVAAPLYQDGGAKVELPPKRCLHVQDDQWKAPLLFQVGQGEKVKLSVTVYQILNSLKHMIFQIPSMYVNWLIRSY